MERKLLSAELKERWESSWRDREERWEEFEESWKQRNLARRLSWEAEEKRLDRELDRNPPFVREVQLRTEKLIQEMVRSFEEAAAQAELQDYAVRAFVRDMRVESREDCEALLALIDRLPPAAAA